ncbi:hypothetical protein C2G38_2230117 [Gigaspora rosea]|uniref:Uncharacterized protein n=1 Tax=Gigaspora rosea TaxID=44941 RepID=A0A397TUF7_9GLOM|nr:hypothetical protein C2G38_2230117 [Gigaspora rosea]
MDPFISLNLQTLKNEEDKKVLLSKAEFNEDIALFAYKLHEAIIVDIKRQEDELKRKYTSEISEKMKSFCNALQKIAGFFNLIKEVLTSIANGVDSGYVPDHKLIKKKAESVKEGCNCFIIAVPEWKTDLMTIESNEHEEYVKNWLSTKPATNGSLFDLCIKFTNDKNYIRRHKKTLKGLLE